MLGESDWTAVVRQTGSKPEEPQTDTQVHLPLGTLASLPHSAEGQPLLQWNGRPEGPFAETPSATSCM